jgi:hypothetical protein
MTGYQRQSAVIRKAYEALEAACAEAEGREDAEDIALFAAAAQLLRDEFGSYLPTKVAA